VAESWWPIVGYRLCWNGEVPRRSDGRLAVDGTHSSTGNAVHDVSISGDAVVGLAEALGKAGVLGLAPDGNAVAGTMPDQLNIALTAECRDIEKRVA
jgi:hypothetical protein